MDANRYQRIREVFFAAAELPGGAQGAFLDEACGEDEDLRRQVEKLLVAEEGDTASDLGLASWSRREPPPLPGRVGPYTLEEEIGRGGMGIVHAARDEQGARVCIKVMHATLLDDATCARRFAREAALGLRLDHPNVVRTLDFGSVSTDAGERHYLVTELVEGRNLRELLNEHGPLGDALLREIGRQVAEGLSAMHAGGIVHRDLKPENIIVDGAMRARIVDFGIALADDRDARLTATGMFIGSLNYAAPEQFRNGEVDARADLYALGRVLLELALGAMPGPTEESGSPMWGPSRTAIEAALDRAGALSEFLRAVLADLMEPARENRLGPASALATLLAQGEAGPWWKKRSETRAGSRWPRSTLPPVAHLVGREKQLAALRDAWGAARAGAGKAVLVVGEPGSGRSAVVGALLESVRGEDAQALRGAYGGLGGGALVEAVRERFGPVGLAPRLSRFLDADTGVVEAFLGDASARTAPERNVDRLWLRLADRLSAELPTLWIIEDLDRAEPHIRRRVLAFARAIRNLRVLLVITTRDEALEAADRAGSERLEQIPLPPLTTEEVGALLESLTGDPSVAADLSATVARRSAGLPLYVSEFVASLRRAAILPAREGGATLVRAVKDARLPSSLSALLQARVEALPEPEDRALLDAAAVAGEEFDPLLLARALEKPRIPLLERLTRLQRSSGMVRAVGAHFRFEPALLREVLYDALPAPLRAAYHGSFGSALQATAADPPAPDDALAIAHHLLRSEEPVSAIPHVVPAVLQLTALGLKVEEHDTLVRALDALDKQPSRTRLFLLHALANSLKRLEEGERADEVIEQALAESEVVGDADIHVGIATTRASRQVSEARPQEALETFAQVEAVAPKLTDPKIAAGRLMIRGKANWVLGRYEEAERDFEEQARIADEFDLPSEEARSRGMTAILHRERGNFEAAHAQAARALELTRQIRDTTNEHTWLIALGNICISQGRLGEALIHFEGAVRKSARLLIHRTRAVALLNMAAIHRRLGWFDRSRVGYEEALRVLRSSGAKREEGYVLDGLAQLARDRGEGDEALEHCEAALALRRSIGNAPGIADSLIVLAWLAIDRGDEEAAARHLDEVDDLATRMSYDAHRVMAAVERAALPGGDLERAVALFGEHGARLQSEWLLRARWVLWRATGDAAYRSAARAQAREIRAHAPVEAQDGLFERAPLLRVACASHP